MNLKLATPVYPDEKILVSYNAGANEIVATNANRVLQNFSDQEIRNDYLGESVIPDAALKLCGFELPYAGNYWADNNSLKHCSLSGDRYYEGAQSLKVDINSVLSSQIFFMQSEPKYFALEPGTYKLMHYIYVEKQVQVLPVNHIAHIVWGLIMNNMMKTDRLSNSSSLKNRRVGS